MNEIKAKLLRSIELHNGEWGWYQLERVVNPRDLPDDTTVMDVLRVMESKGLVVQQPATPQNKYAITDEGRRSLTEITSKRRP